MLTKPRSALQTALLPRIMDQAIRENRARGLIYLNNPKVGCSTIKSSLWLAITGQNPADQKANVHLVEGSPFASKLTDAATAQTAFIFTFVRNPFQRLVSAYLNKVRDRTDQVWPGFAGRHGLDPDADMSFDGFVELLAGVPPEDHDPHWRPQHLNILYPFVRPNMIGDLEGLDRDLPQVLARIGGGQVVQGRKHRTAAREIWAGYYADPATRARVLQIYGGDFEAFGYATGVGADPARRQATVLSGHDHAGLAAVVAYLNADNAGRCDALNRVEAADGGGALQDWILHQRLRHPRLHRTSVAGLVQAHGPQITGGPAYLRRLVDPA